MSSHPGKPIAVGLIGLGRHGRHHRERLSLRDDFHVVAVATTDDAGRDDASGSRRHHDEVDWRSFVQRPDIELVVVDVEARDRSAVIRAALEAGRHVAADRWFGAAAHDAAELLALAASQGRMLTILQERRGDGDFRTARALIERGEVGEVDAVQLISWSPRMPPTGVDRIQSDTSRGLPTAVAALLPAFDQVVRLIAARPRTLFLNAAPTDDPQSPADAPVFRRVSALIQFDGGATATVDLHRDAGIAFESGWMVSGRRGGYRHRRVHRLMDDGELFDMPCETLPTDFTSLDDDLAAGVRGVARPDDARAAIHLAALIDGAIRSLESGVPVDAFPAVS